MIYGNIDGIKASLIDKLEEIYDLKIPRSSVLTEDMVNVLCSITSDINREISIAADRKGQIMTISVGNSGTVEMPQINTRRKKLSGIRILHTHPNGNSTLSCLDLSALLKLKLDCVAAVGVANGYYTNITMGFCKVQDNILNVESLGPFSIYEAENFNFASKIRNIEEDMKSIEQDETEGENAILVGIESEESLNELCELAKACNVEVCDTMIQKRTSADTEFYIGSGKVDEIAAKRQAYDANLIIFDDELSGSQLKNLEEKIGVKVIDRTTLILEIFARRAKSKEAIIQVEAAQLKYRLARLVGLGSVMSRTGGGIGTRGPGEKKLEVDRRHIKQRLFDLHQELNNIKKVRKTQREKRNREDIERVSLVGYTNAGKSTLRNKLCKMAMPKNLVHKGNVFEADMLFATLDVTTRAISLPDSRIVTLTDTVGFIRKLPHDLVESFKSTLEEVIFSDLLLHVVDVSSESAEEQIKTVNNVLSELGAGEKPMVIVLNKIDKANEETLFNVRAMCKSNRIVEISAKYGDNLDALLNEIADSLPQKLKTAEYFIPYENQNVLAYIHRSSRVDSEEFTENGTHIKALVDDEVYNKCIEYLM